MLNKKLTLLLIEDHSGFRKCTREYLEFVMPNVSVIEAGGSEQAFALLKIHPIELVITDFNLPGMNGIEITGDLVVKYPGTKIIMMTGHYEEEIVRSAFTAGIMGFVTKHDSSLDLVDCIEAVMKGGTFVSRSVRLNRLNHHMQEISHHTVH
ncbi:MAG: response regulator [Bacteroidota bacterium]